VVDEQQLLHIFGSLQTTNTYQLWACWMTCPRSHRAVLSCLLCRALPWQVLAGALKDSKRGLIAGERTFGKGLIQTVVDLSDGSGVAVTVARYQTPAGVDINKIGVSPDVQLAPEALPTDLAGVCRVLGSDAAPRLFG
jgi:hypothetical protein